MTCLRCGHWMYIEDVWHNSVGYFLIHSCPICGEKIDSQILANRKWMEDEAKEKNP